MNALSNTVPLLTKTNLRTHNFRNTTKVKVFLVHYNGEIQSVPDVLPDHLTLTHQTRQGAGPSRQLARDAAGQLLLQDMHNVLRHSRSGMLDNELLESLAFEKQRPIHKSVSNANLADERRQQLGDAQTAAIAAGWPICVKVIKHPNAAAFQRRSSMPTECLMMAQLFSCMRPRESD